MKIKKTRYAGLVYACVIPGLWRVGDAHDKMPTTGSEFRAVGPRYASEAELLADLDRYARETWNY